MTNPSQQVPRHALLRQALFLCGLAVLLTSAVAYVWIQRPLGESIALERQLAKNVGRIMTLDEVLTMSARMAAAAHEPSYEARYNANVEELDRTIKATLGLVDDAEVTRFVSATDAANLRLVDMETRSFELDKKGQYAEALALLNGDAYRADKAVYADGMGKAFARLETITAERRASVERWSLILQLVGVLSLLVVLAAWRLEQRAQRARAAAYAADLEAQVKLRTAELERRNLGMRLVLDNVGQGLITIDADGKMASEHSAVLHSWFGAPSENQNLCDYLGQHAPAFGRALEMGLEQLRDNVLPIELLFDQLPSQFRVGSRIFEVTFSRIGEDEPVSQLLAIVSDITERVAHERSEREQAELVALFQHISVDRAGVEEFIAEAADLVGALYEETNPVVQRRLVHTLKGNCAIYGMESCAELAHTIETELEETGNGLTEVQRSSLVAAWKAAMLRVSPLLDGGRHEAIEIDRGELEEAVRELGKIPMSRALVVTLSSWTRTPVVRAFERLTRQVQSLSRRLGRPVPTVVTQGGRLRLEHECWQPFWAAMTHVVRNAISHGIESPTERQRCGKAEVGRIEMSAARAHGRITLSVRDDGRGIQWEKVRTKAAEKGLLHGSRAELVDALFADGLSTNDEVSEISGRGVGLSALQETVRHLGGTIQVDSEPGQGTTFRFTFDERQIAAVIPSGAHSAAHKHASLLPHQA
jgi:two-component sensor histidine kinase/HPt (histidine-containing phosphotransfer) domain-containing protein